MPSIALSLFICDYNFIIYCPIVNVDVTQFYTNSSLLTRLSHLSSPKLCCDFYQTILPSCSHLPIQYTPQMFRSTNSKMCCRLFFKYSDAQEVSPPSRSDVPTSTSSAMYKTEVTYEGNIIHLLCISASSQSGERKDEICRL